VKIRLLAQALADLDEAAIWYEDQQQGLGDEFMAEIGQHFSLLVENPAIWPLWPRARSRRHPVRRLLLSRFPYGIAYQVIDDTIVVLSVAAHKKRPRFWSGRAQR
jgi:toxin ParE1/3/4